MRLSLQNSICAYNSECAGKYNSSTCDCKQGRIFVDKNVIRDDNDNQNGWQQWVIIKLKCLSKSTELWTVNLTCWPINFGSLLLSYLFYKFPSSDRTTFNKQRDYFANPSVYLKMHDCDVLSWSL